MKKIFTILAVALFLGACHCTKCTRSACHMNKQATCACAQHHKAGQCAAKHKAGCKCAKCKKAGCKKHHGKDCPCAKAHQAPAPAPKPVVKPAPKPAPKKVQEDKDLAAVGKVTTKADNTAVFSFDKPINFKVNSDEIQDTKDIQQVARALKKYPNANVRVAGYTDSIGEADYNLDLSKRRAKAVADELIKQGVPADHVSFVGFGENNPIATNKTAAGRAQNRRVELEIK